jgi:hypothetical protein
MAAVEVGVGVAMAVMGKLGVVTVWEPELGPGPVPLDSSSVSYASGLKIIIYFLTNTLPLNRSYKADRLFSTAEEWSTVTLAITGSDAWLRRYQREDKASRQLNWTTQ